MSRRYVQPVKTIRGHTIVIGHPESMTYQAIDAVKAAKMACSMKNARVGIVGEKFAGMGDFQIPYDKLKDLIGIEVFVPLRN